jgi:hypothetical protein
MTTQARTRGAADSLTEAGQVTEATASASWYQLLSGPRSGGKRCHQGAAGPR